MIISAGNVKAVLLSSDAVQKWTHQSVVLNAAAEKHVVP